jgi:hypothetical protein
MTLVWKDARQQYSTKEYGYLGSVKAFAVFYNGCASKGEKGNSYCLTPLLPGFTKERYYNDDKSILQTMAEQMLEQWLVATGLELKQEPRP